MGKALAKRADMVFAETGLRLVKILPPERKSVAKWRVEHLLFPASVVTAEADLEVFEL